MKCTVRSSNGSAMVIPHGNNVVRIYVQIIDPNTKDQDLWKLATESKVQQAAKDILKPYYIEWERVDWYSVYTIGQGIAERYSLGERIFMGGDACHTHSVWPPSPTAFAVAILTISTISQKLAKA